LLASQKQRGAGVIQGCAQFRFVDVGVVERAVASIAQQLQKCLDSLSVWIVGSLKRVGDLEQVAAHRGGSVAQ
jgi:hypothetical protein